MWHLVRIFFFQPAINQSYHQPPPWRTMMAMGICHWALLPMALMTLSLTPSCLWVVTFYNAPQLELLPLLLLLHLVMLSGALWIETKHILNRNGNNTFNSGSRLLAAVVLVTGKGNNSSQLQAFLSNSKLNQPFPKLPKG